MLLHVCISVPTTGRKVCPLSEIAVDKERIHQLISSLKYYKIREHSKQRSSLTVQRSSLTVQNRRNFGKSAGTGSPTQTSLIARHRKRTFVREEI